MDREVDWATQKSMIRAGGGKDDGRRQCVQESSIDRSGAAARMETDKGGGQWMDLAGGRGSIKIGGGCVEPVVMEGI